MIAFCVIVATMNMKKRLSGLTFEDEMRLKSFIVSKEKKAITYNLSPRDDELIGVADLHMHRLLDLYMKLSTTTTNGFVITK